MDLIEFPVLKVNSKTFEFESEFHSHIQPTIHKLNPVCTEITGITQAMVRAANTPPSSEKTGMDQWMKKEGLLEEGVRSCFVTCGDWDLKTGLPVQCQYQKS